MNSDPYAATWAVASDNIIWLLLAFAIGILVGWWARKRATEGA